MYYVEFGLKYPKICTNSQKSTTVDVEVCTRPQQWYIWQLINCRRFKTIGFQVFYKRVCNIIAMVNTKLMRLGVPNRIDVVDSNLKSESERRIVVDSDSNE